MNYTFHPEAERELYEGALRYESEIPGLGHRFVDEIQRVVGLLLDIPISARALTITCVISCSGDSLSRLSMR